MSVTVRPYRNGGWEVDVRFRLPNGQRHRERSKAPVNSKSAAQRWGDDRERHLLQHGLPEPKKEVPRFEEFAPRFMDGYARANRQKPSSIAAKEMILRVHLLPVLGSKKLDAITTEDVQCLKTALNKKAPKTVNNVLSVLNTALKTALTWNVIDRIPCTIRLVPVAKTASAFHDFDDYEHLVSVGKQLDAQTYLIVLLGGDAGLRCGEMIALEWEDVDLQSGLMTIRHSDWNGQVNSPKGGRLRHVPLTGRLADAFRQVRHLRSRRVLVADDGEPLTRQMVQYRVKRAASVAGLKHRGVHVLRHTFCSHLAMDNAPARTIQELAGHAELLTTQGYMHLQPSALNEAINLLECSRVTRRRGDNRETQRRVGAKSNC